MRVALVHEFLTQYGGAERVLEALHELFPKAPVYTLIYDKEKLGDRFHGWDIKTSFIQKLPGSVKNYKWYLPMMPRAIERFELDKYDLILSDSSAFAKGVVTSGKTKHICYCHTPTRYLWMEMDEYVQSLPYSNFIKAFVKLYLKSTLKPWDYEAAQRPDVMIANSETVRERIKKYYNREAQVIHPPVDTEFFKHTDPSTRFARLGSKNNLMPEPAEGYFLTGGRLEPYKKIDLAVSAFNSLGLPLKVVGTGTKLAELQKSAGSNVEFLGKVSDESLRDLYSEARAFVFPALEDAGIAVLESLSCGTPVIGFGRGGTAEFVNKENGILFSEQNARAIVEAVNKFERLEFDPEGLRTSAQRYGKEQFKKRIKEVCGLE